MLSTFLAEAAPPAGGAALDQIIIATGFAGIGLAALAFIAWRQRTGRGTYTGKVADHVSTLDGAPAWMGFPVYVLIGALLTAVFGMYWDISIHIDEGRDEGPLANPAHWFILVGLFGILVAGVLSAAFSDRPLPRRTLRLPGGWHVPYGSVLIAAAGTFSLLGFPLDDVWHRLFGQDVTLYGPTHLMLIGGATLSTAAGWLLLTEGRQVMRKVGRAQRFLEVQVAGAFLIGLSTFQAEFDFSVPQFRFVIEPVLLMVAASIALVTARVRIGRGGAIAAVLIFFLVRGIITLAIAGPLDNTTPYFPLYLGSALLVEGIAFFVKPSDRLRFGLACGVAIGTIGLATEWGWSYVWSHMPWPAALLPEAAILGLIAAVGGALLGAWIGERLNATAAQEGSEQYAVAEREHSTVSKVAVAAGFAAAVAAIAACVPITATEKITVQGELREVQGGPERMVEGTFRFSPQDAAEDHGWLNVTAWQGGGSVQQDLEEVSPGVYRTTAPIPVHGNWKTTIRMEKGTQVLGLPIWMPEDEAIPAPEVPATATFTRDFILDKKLLQREQKQGVDQSLWTLAYLTVLAITVVTITGIGWGMHIASKPGRGQRRKDGPHSSDGDGSSAYAPDAPQERLDTAGSVRA